MMKSKECLEDIKLILYENLEFHMDVDELIEPIKQDLERLEKLEEENDKLKKVIEILKDRFEIVAITEDRDSEYIIETLSYFLYITKEQYELLKEVLKDD